MRTACSYRGPLGPEDFPYYQGVFAGAGEPRWRAVRTAGGELARFLTPEAAHAAARAALARL